MDRERLTHLRNILTQVRSENFDMTEWATDPEEFDLDLQSPDECGMMGCAGGYAASDKHFIRQGLHLVNEHPRFGDARDFIALSLFFNISDRTSRFLFDPDAYLDEGRTKEPDQTTPDEVIERIDQLLTHGERDEYPAPCIRTFTVTRP